VKQGKREHDTTHQGDSSSAVPLALWRARPARQGGDAPAVRKNSGQTFHSFHCLVSYIYLVAETLLNAGRHVKITSTKAFHSFRLCPHALLLDLIQDSYSMASARKAALHKRLDVVRDKVALELEQVPVDVYKIDVYKELIHNLTEELKTLNSTRGELLICFLERQSDLCTSAWAQLQATQDVNDVYLFWLQLAITFNLFILIERYLWSDFACICSISVMSGDKAAIAMAAIKLGIISCMVCTNSAFTVSGQCFH